MKRYIRADALDESVYDDCYEEVLSKVIEFIEAEEAWSYDDVVAEVYAQIQSYFDNTHAIPRSEVEDKCYEDIMDALDRQGYIDHRQGLLLY